MQKLENAQECTKTAVNLEREEREEKAVPVKVLADNLITTLHVTVILEMIQNIIRVVLPRLLLLHLLPQPTRPLCPLIHLLCQPTHR